VSYCDLTSTVGNFNSRLFLEYHSNKYFRNGNVSVVLPGPDSIASRIL